MEDPTAFSKYNLSTINCARILLSKYKDHFKFGQDEDILEVGCAGGVITREVLFPFVEKHVKYLLATDIDQKAVELANQVYSTDKISFLQMDIEKEGLWRENEEKYCHIFAFFVLHMLKSTRRWSVNVAKMLKPKAQFFASVLLLPTTYSTITAHQKIDKLAPWAKYLELNEHVTADFGPDPKETISSILSSVGLHIDTIEVQPHKFSFKTIQDLRGTFLGLNTFLKYIPENLRSAYIEDYLNKVVDAVAEADDGSYYIINNILTVIATKP